MKIRNLFLQTLLLSVTICIAHSSYGQANEAPVPDATASATATVVKHCWEASEFGVTPSETVDQTAALQALLDKVGEQGGGFVMLATGKYRIEGNLSIPSGVTLKGTFNMSPTVDKFDEKINGTVLLAYAGKGDPNGKPFITLAGNNSTLQGVVIMYPEWDRTILPPVPYPPCIASRHTNNVGVIDCCLLNPYEGIHLVEVQRHFLRNITGYPIWRGLFVDQCYDIGHVENFHFWPFGLVYKANDPYCEWINKNGVAFEFARTDWEYVSNTFCFGYGVGYKFSAYKHGSANGNFLGLGADSCRRGVLVEQSQAPGLLITNGEFVGRWTSTDSVGVEIKAGNQGKVSLNNCSFWGETEANIRSSSQQGQLTVNACHFWDTAGRNTLAIQLEAGKAIISNNTFQRMGPHIEVQKTVSSAIISGNQADGGLFVEGGKLPQTIMFGNEPSTLERMTNEDKLNYTIDVGTHNDSGFLQAWYYAERVGRNTCRWSTPESKVLLPVIPGKAYQLTLQIKSNPYLKSEEPQKAGLWLDGKQIATLSSKSSDTIPGMKEGQTELTVEIPAQTQDLLTLEIRTPGWIPAETSNSQDKRVLGIYVSEIKMKAVENEGAAEK